MLKINTIVLLSLLAICLIQTSFAKHKTVIHDDDLDDDFEAQEINTLKGKKPT